MTAHMTKPGGGRDSIDSVERRKEGAFAAEVGITGTAQVHDADRVEDFRAEHDPRFIPNEDALAGRQRSMRFLHARSG